MFCLWSYLEDGGCMVLNCTCGLDVGKCCHCRLLWFNVVAEPTAIAILQQWWNVAIGDCRCRVMWLRNPMQWRYYSYNCSCGPYFTSLEILLVFDFIQIKTSFPFDMIAYSNNFVLLELYANYFWAFVGQKHLFSQLAWFRSKLLFYPNEKEARVWIIYVGCF